MTILGMQYDADATKEVPEPYKKQLLHIFPAGGIVSYKEFISIPLYVRLKWTRLVVGRALKHRWINKII